MDAFSDPAVVAEQEMVEQDKNLDLVVQRVRPSLTPQSTQFLRCSVYITTLLLCFTIAVLFEVSSFVFCDSHLAGQ